MWISSGIQGLVEMEELPINESVPIKRENPWGTYGSQQVQSRSK
jgi:hypothetical protein